MVASVVVFLTMAILSVYCAGLEVLPPGPANGTLGGNVFFKTTINPTTLSAIVWTFGDPPVIIVDFLSSEGPVTGEGYVGRISLDNSTGSLELLKLTIADNGEYRVILRESDLMYLSNTSLNVYAEGSLTPDGLSVVVITGIVIIVLLVVEVAVSVAVYFIKKNGSNVEPMHRGGSQQHVYENPSPVYENPSPVYENPSPENTSPVYENPSPVYENPSPVRDNTQQNQSPPLPLTLSHSNECVGSRDENDR
ncbi:uncharacterized protein isoform X2 [Salmo salar]|uniref:Uncharacterized protein isoform X2 n=1 Tax=Salmo salar TaxID=8030 RepID=A0ABM3DCV2_SALSA|nr:uncharacterized protein LOC123728690 isoform X2 [Salmo salar]